MKYAIKYEWAETGGEIKSRIGVNLHATKESAKKTLNIIRKATRITCQLELETTEQFSYRTGRTTSTGERIEKYTRLSIVEVN